MPSTGVRRQPGPGILDRGSKFSAAVWKKLFRHSRDAVLIANDDGICLFSNPAACALLGMASESIVGRRVGEFLDPPPGRDSEEPLPSLLRRGDGTTMAVESVSEGGDPPGLRVALVRAIEEEGPLPNVEEALNDALIGTWSWDLTSAAGSCSELMFRLFGLEPHQPVKDFGAFLERVHPDETQIVSKAVERCLRYGQPLKCDFRVPQGEGRSRLIVARARLSRDAGGRPLRLFGTCQDVTDIKVQTGLKILEAAPDPTVVTDMGGRMMLVNRQAERMFGWSRLEMFGRPAEMLVAETVRGRYQEHLRQDLADPASHLLELEGRRKDGSAFPMELTFNPMETSLGMLLACAIRDLGERRRAEEALREKEKLRLLTVGLLNGQEEERLRLSRELHDGLNQELAVLAVELDSLRHSLPPTSKVRRSVGAVHDRVAALSDEVRRIAHALHPAPLEHLGLPAALRSLREDFQTRDLRVRLRCRNVSGSIPSEIALNLFRIAQECLHNAARHSGSKKANVSLSVAAGIIRLVIRDEGRGFAPESAAVRRGLGLVSMEERARLIGGTFSLRTHPGGGAEVEVCVPLQCPYPGSEPQSGAR